MLILPYKTWGKPRFEFFRFGFFFLFLIFFGFCVFSVHPTVVLVLLSASVKRFVVSRLQDFLYDTLVTYM